MGGTSVKGGGNYTSSMNAPRRVQTCPKLGQKRSCRRFFSDPRVHGRLLPPYAFARHLKAASPVKTPPNYREWCRIDQAVQRMIANPCEIKRHQL